DLQVPPAGEPREERGLLDDRSDLPDHPRESVRDVGPEQAHRPRVGTDQPDEAADRRRLAGPVRSQEAEHPALGDLEIESGDGDGSAAAQPSVLLTKPLDLDHAHAGEPYPGGRHRAEGRRDGWKSGTTGSQPRRNTSTSDGGVTRTRSARAGSASSYPCGLHRRSASPTLTYASSSSVTKAPSGSGSRGGGWRRWGRGARWKSSAGRRSSIASAP